MPNDRTIYTITNKATEQSTISIFKLDADVLQETIENVHDYVQKTYNSVSAYYPNLSRRKHGDIVRYLMTKKATKNPVYLKRLSKYL